jgi:hypothetical protein
VSKGHDDHLAPLKSLLPDTLKAPAGAANLWRAFAEALTKAKSPAAAA